MFVFLIFRCRNGFIPIYERGEDGIRKLNNCHDPIIVTSTVGGRCLIPEHCDHLVKFKYFQFCCLNVSSKFNYLKNNLYH
jgi:hypothetical protein